MLTYVSLGRVGEIVRGRYSYNPPITTRDIEINTDMIYISILTEKTGKLRRIPISRVREAWLTEPIIKYARLMNGALFPYSTRWGEKIFKKYIGLPLGLECIERIHYLRKWRTTHLLQGHGTKERLDIQAVRRLGGWVNLESMSKHYDGTTTADYEELI